MIYPARMATGGVHRVKKPPPHSTREQQVQVKHGNNKQTISMSGKVSKNLKQNFGFLIQTTSKMLTVLMCD